MIRFERGKNYRFYCGEWIGGNMWSLEVGGLVRSGEIDFIF